MYRADTIATIKDHLLTHFDVDLSKEVVNKFINRQIQNSFKEYRSELHKHYCKFENPLIARENPSERIANKEDWKILCDQWETSEWQEKREKNKKSREGLSFNHCCGSKTFFQVQNELTISKGEKVGQVELFHKSHF